MDPALWLICFLVGVIFGFINLIQLLRAETVLGSLLSVVGVLGGIVAIALSVPHVFGGVA